jgi:ribonuclease P protein component
VNAPKEPPTASSSTPQARIGFRFPRTAKLLKHSDFQRVYKSGRRHFSEAMTVFYAIRADELASGPRIGITVSRAIGGAVQRNRVKRRMREAIRFHLAELNDSVDVVFNPKKAVLEVEFTQIDLEVKRAFAVIRKNVARSSKERSTAP